MGYLLLTKIIFSPQPSVTQFVDIRYRLKSAPDLESSYTLYASNVPVPKSGIFSYPGYAIDGVPEETEFVVWIQNKCSGAYIKADIHNKKVPVALSTTTTTPATTTVSPSTTQAPTTTLPQTTVPPATTTQAATTTNGVT